MDVHHPNAFHKSSDRTSWLYSDDGKVAEVTKSYPLSQGYKNSSATCPK